MKFDFDRITDRHGTNSLKWDFAAERGMPDGLLPMWVADMDFPAPPEVLEDIQKAAAQSAYTHGAAWLAELKTYIESNIKYIRDFLAEHLPKVKLVDTQGTYLLWLDFSAYGLSQDELDRRTINGAKLWLDSGTMFGEEGKGFQRINIACPRSVLAEALEHLAKEFEG